MWLLDRLLATPVGADATVGAGSARDAADSLEESMTLPETGGRRFSLKRTARAGRMPISPWQKVATFGRRARN